MTILSNLPFFNLAMQPPQDLSPELRAAFDQARRLDPGLTIPKFLENQTSSASPLSGNPTNTPTVTLGVITTSIVATKVPRTFAERYQAIVKASAEGTLAHEIPLVDAFVKDVMHIIDQEIERAGGMQDAFIHDAIDFLEGKKLSINIPKTNIGANSNYGGRQRVNIDFETTVRARIVSEGGGFGLKFQDNMNASGKIFEEVAQAYRSAKRPVVAPPVIIGKPVEQTEFPRRAQTQAPSSFLGKIIRRLLRR